MGETACCRREEVTECRFSGWKYQVEDKDRDMKLSDVGFSATELSCHAISSRSEKPCCSPCHNMMCCTSLCSSCCFYRIHHSCTMCPDEDIPCEVGCCGIMCKSAKAKVAKA